MKIETYFIHSIKINSFASAYGDFIGEFDNQKYYAFPRIESMIHENFEQELRGLGFGYRAKYISKAVHYLNLKKKDYLLCLREKSYQETKEALLMISGGKTSIFFHLIPLFDLIQFHSHTLLSILLVFHSKSVQKLQIVLL